MSQSQARRQGAQWGAGTKAHSGAAGLLGAPWPGEQTSHSLPLLPQLWYFWRRHLFIWISFVDSYFELLLYVGPPSLPCLRPR